HRHDFEQAQGESDQTLLVSGHFLAFTDHPRPSWNDLWLLTEIHHQGKQPQVLEESVTDFSSSLRASSPLPPGEGPGVREAGATDFIQGYRNHFTATPWAVPYRPSLQHPKPRILGSQSAVVTGPAGEEIHCDQYGRVKVQFFWDRQGQANDKTSCWLRVSSSWAGDRYGAIAIPRIGMEVLVTFLEGDPDQPLVTGCLYHKEHVVPYDLPANKTRTVIKTLSSPGGGGYNELRIEDKKGAEQIYIHAERDWDKNIEHDQKIRIGHERHDTVEANSYSEFKAEEHRTTHLDRKSEIKANDHLSVGNNQHIKIGTGQFINAGSEIHLSSGQKVVLEAGSELTFKAAGSFIKLDASGITMVGPIIKFNSGGGPGNGSGAAPVLPVIPKPADTAPTGEKTGQARINSLFPITGAAQQGPENLIVDVWGDPALGGQVQLLDPEAEA
ncbi:MAG: type VI secretion system tip protein TssI/VgrG, partial [Pseudomonas sp.]|uniref:type VI secretion system tip protein TssI/VgrG n=1 Tax=Pseudomonas sp. TaxID=306 RepID=UPI003BB6CB8B